MCIENHPQSSAGEDEFVLDTPLVRGFVEFARSTIAHAASPAVACDRLAPRFHELLLDQTWLPREYQEDAPQSGMGGGIGQWLLFRAGDSSLCLFSLVVPPGAATPVHDHLAFGLVGLYRGNQDEEFFNPEGGTLVRTKHRPLVAGDYYRLIPPRDDIHRVRTTSPVTSVSIHLIANDTGCTWRHTFTDQGEALPFRSGWVNAPCEPITRESQ